MTSPRRLAGFLVVALLAGVAAAPAQAHDERLRDDVGGFEPSKELIDEASAFGSPIGRGPAVAAIEAATPAHRIDVLRTGLRLRDDAAGRVCAARLEWKQIDRWECARCVDLLMDDVLRRPRYGDWEEVRSYLGSVELTRLLQSLPPLPWSVDPSAILGDTHRIARAEHIPVFQELLRTCDPALVAGAESTLGVLSRWSDFVAEPVSDGEGLTPAYAAWLREEYFTERFDEDRSFRVIGDDRLWTCKPGPRDAELLIALTAHGESWELGEIRGQATFVMGKLSDPVTETFLRERAVEGVVAARHALIRRGDKKLLDELVADLPHATDFALALLMEVDPVRARRVIEETLLGPDDEAANGMLDELADFVPPGARETPLGYDWRRTSFDGFEQAALASKASAPRLAAIAAVVPGCRTRAVARAAAEALRSGDLVWDGQRDLEPDRLRDLGSFLESGAPDAFRAALRPSAAAGGDDAERVTRWLVKLGDPDAAEAFLRAGYEVGWLRWRDLARTKAPGVRSALEESVRAWLASGDADDAPAEEVSGLAVWHGVPEDAASFSFFPLPRAAVELVLAGRPIDALATCLAASPDESHYNVGAVDDPRVRGYLVRLRERRDLGHYWYATAQLAVLGDPAARADFWGAMQDGRYRIMDSADLFERTLGWRLSETMPFWIDELRSQCCRVTTSGAGDIVERTLGISGYDTGGRAPYRRVKELWDVAGGRFVKSRIAGHWVPEPR